MDEPPNEGSEPQKTPQERFEEQARAKSQQAKQVALATWQGADTIAEKMLIVGSILGIISFFLPWVSASFIGTSINMSGLELARRGDESYWLFPIMMAVALFFGWLNLHGDAKKHILNSRWLILIGAAWSWMFVNTLLSTNSESAGTAGVGFGGYLSFIASLLILISGIMQVQDNLRLMPSSSERL